MLLFIHHIYATSFFILSHIPLFYKTFSIFPNRNTIFSYFPIFLSFEGFPRFLSISVGKISTILFYLLFFSFNNPITRTTIFLHITFSYSFSCFIVNHYVFIKLYRSVSIILLFPPFIFFFSFYVYQTNFCYKK